MDQMLMTEKPDDVTPPPPVQRLTPQQSAARVNEVVSDFRQKHPELDDIDINAITETLKIEDTDPESALRGGKGRFRYIPKSIQEVGESIMEEEGINSKFGKGKAWAIVKDVKEENNEKVKKVFVQENFLRWMRYKILTLSNLNSDDPVNFFGELK